MKIKQYNLANIKHKNLKETNYVVIDNNYLQIKRWYKIKSWKKEFIRKSEILKYKKKRHTEIEEKEQKQSMLRILIFFL